MPARFDSSFLQDLKLLKSLSIVLPPRPDAPMFPEETTEEDRQADAEFQLCLEGRRLRSAFLLKTFAARSRPASNQL